MTEKEATAEATGSPIYSTVLANGLEVLLVPKAGVPLVTIAVAVRAGAFVETPELDGLTHLHEHMFFKANAAIPDQESYIKRLDELGMSWNGSTSHEVVRYYFTLPSTLLEEGLVFMRDAIQTPLFASEELEKERRVVLSEYDRGEARPEFHLWRGLEKELFGRHYSRKNVIGDREIIRTASREKLQAIQDTFYVPNNSALILSGSFELAKGLERVDALFAGWERRADPFEGHPVPEHPPLLENRYLLVDQPVRGASLRVSWHGPSVARDPRDTVVADVLYKVLSQPTSPLQRALVDSGLASSAALSYYTLKHVGPITLGLETTPDRVLDALGVARLQIEEWTKLEDSLDEASLDRAKRDLIRVEVFERERARDFAIALGFWWSVGGTEYFERYLDRVGEVTAADLRAFVRKYLSRPHVVAAMVSEESRAEHGIDAASLREAIDPSPLTRTAAADGSETLTGGALVISRALEAPPVSSLRLCIRGVPERVPVERAGLEELLLVTLVDRFRRDREDDLSRLGAKVTFSTQPDYSSLAVTGLSGSFSESIALLAQVFREQPFDESDLERNRARMLDAYRKSLENPDRRVAYLADEVFYPPGHPYLAYSGGTEESLLRLTVDDLIEHRRSLVEAAHLFVGVGTAEGESLRQRLEECFAGLHSSEPRDAAFPPLEHDEDAPRLRVEHRDIPTNYVLGKFSAPPPRQSDALTLCLALRILSRRLWLEVRSKRALTYAVSSGLAIRAQSFGYLYVSSASPNEAVKAMLDTVDDMVQEPISPEDLRASALTFSTSENLGLEAAAGLASRLASDEILAGDYRETMRLEERLREIDPEDIRKALELYVRDICFGVLGRFGVLGPAKGLDEELFARR